MKYSIIYCGSYITNSLGTKRLLETKFLEKKAIVPVTKTFWPSFPRIIEHQKSKTTSYKGSQGVFVFIV